MTGSAADIFISYKAEDRSRLQPLVAALEAEGFTVWWDAHIGGGTNWRQDIQEHLDAAKCVIVAWSKRSVGPEGEFVRDEAMRAKRHHTYLPIRIDDVAPPLGFGEVQALSLKNWKGDRSDPRLVAVVDAVRERLTGDHIEHHRDDHVQRRVSRRAALAGGIGAIAIAGTGGWLLLKPGAADARRIAVLPFANLSGDQEQAYFSDGIAEELRAALSRIGMEVIGRSSSVAVKDLDSKAAAAKLGVANILTGSVRRSSEMIRVNAQLVSGKDGVERWAQSYDRVPGDAIKIQTDIAANVAQALSIALGQVGRAALTLGSTTDSVAQDLILQGRKLRLAADTAEDFEKILALTEAAIARDPNYAQAFVEKSSVMASLSSQYSNSAEQVAERLGRAEAAANRALAIAPSLGSAHAALANIEQLRQNFSASLQHLRRALALSPADPDVLSIASGTLPYLGQDQEGLQLADELIALDPLNGRSYRRKAETLYVLRQYPKAIEAGRKALAVQPENRTPNLWIGFSLLLAEEPKEALAAFRSLPDGDGFRFTGEALVAAQTGNVAQAEKMASELWEKAGTAYVYQQAQIRAQLGQKDRAFAELDMALAAKDSGLVYLKKDPFLDPIRGDPRFAVLLKKLNFPG